MASWAHASSATGRQPRSHGIITGFVLAESQWSTKAAQLGAAHRPDFMALAAHGTRPSVPSQAEQAVSSKQTSLGIERRVDELIERIRPNKASDTRRKIVSDYVKGLIRGCFSPVEKVRPVCISETAKLAHWVRQQC